MCDFVCETSHVASFHSIGQLRSQVTFSFQVTFCLCGFERFKKAVIKWIEEQLCGVTTLHKSLRSLQPFHLDDDIMSIVCLANWDHNALLCKRDRHANIH